MHAAVDTLGHLLTLYATPADAQDWDQVAELARRVQQARGTGSKSPSWTRASQATAQPRMAPPMASAWSWKMRFRALSEATSAA